MQSVTAAFTAEEKDSVRKIAHNLQVSWKKQTNPNVRMFTIAVSTIGGGDVIGINPGAVGSPGLYQYFDESEYVTSLGWERGLSYPKGGVSKAMAEAELSNISGRFTPRYMGGNSELFTAILPRRPVTISAGFNYGVDIMLPQFAGVVTEQPRINMRDRTMRLKMADYIDFFQNKYLDQTTMFTAESTDTVLASMMTKLGMSTAQYDFDEGINIIPFGIFEVNTKFSDIIAQLVEAENGQFYQDESGVFKFENRQHYTNSPYNAVQKIITTSMVINAEAPSENNIVNVVEIKSKVRAKQPSQLLFSLSSALELPALTETDLFVQFDDPILELNTPTFWSANTTIDGSGTDKSTSVSVKTVDKFPSAARIVFRNNHTDTVFMTSLSLYGRPAKVVTDIDYRAKDGSSVTAYEEAPLRIENNFIQSASWAQTYAQMILNDFSDISSVQKITVRAMPELQLGDLISWQGKYWRIYDARTTLDPAVGFVQELTMLQRTINTYFRIGISTIGDGDQISP